MDLPESSRIYRLADDIVNVYLVEDQGQVTIVDAGVPGYWKKLPGALERMGRTVEDVRAILLTHGHTDHVGFAERARRERNWPISIHELDEALAMGTVPNQARNVGSVRPLPILSFLLWGARRGALRPAHVGAVSTFGDGATLDVPGAPRIIHVPGHTPGSAAIFFEDR